MPGIAPGADDARLGVYQLPDLLPPALVISFGPGWHAPEHFPDGKVLRLHSLEPAEQPAALSGGEDTRYLTIAFPSWSLRRPRR